MLFFVLFSIIFWCFLVYFFSEFSLKVYLGVQCILCLVVGEIHAFLFIRKSSIRKLYQTGKNLKTVLVLAQKSLKSLKQFSVESNSFHLYSKPTRDITDIENLKIIIMEQHTCFFIRKLVMLLVLDFLKNFSKFWYTKTFLRLS